MRNIGITTDSTLINVETSLEDPLLPSSFSHPLTPNIDDKSNDLTNCEDRTSSSGSSSGDVVTDTTTSLFNKQAYQHLIKNTTGNILQVSLYDIQVFL